MLKITFLGTSGSAPTKERNMSAIAVEYNSNVFLFDCGEGVQRQMMIYGLNMFKIKAIFLTHIHGDHSLGVAGIVRTLALLRRTEPLYIYIPKGFEKALSSLLGFDRAVIGYKIHVLQLKTGTIYKGEGFVINTFRVKHTVDTYGFVFKENDRVRFLKDKIKSLGIRGTMFAQLLKHGYLNVNGRKITLSSVSYKQKGKSIVYATDTRPSANTAKTARNADLLIHESSYAGSEKKLARERFHSTSEEAAMVAKQARVKKLILTHISTRYKDTNILLKNARKIFQNTEVARDGMVVTL